MEGRNADRKKIVERLVGSLKDIAKNLQHKTETERFLTFLAWLNSELERAGLGRIIIVGGFAAEIYSGRAYRTGDVDIIVEGDEEVVKEFLKKVSDIGLRIYLLRFPQLSEKGIDIVGTKYEKDKGPVSVKVGEWVVYMAPPEEVILSCLSAWKYWNSLEDRDKAFLVLAAQRERLDMEFLKKAAEREGVLDRLKELEKLL